MLLAWGVGEFFGVPRFGSIELFLEDFLILGIFAIVFELDIIGHTHGFEECRGLGVTDDRCRGDGLDGVGIGPRDILTVVISDEEVKIGVVVPLTSPDIEGVDDCSDEGVDSLGF